MSTDTVKPGLRAQAAPHGVMGLLVLSGCAARAAAHLTGQEAAVAGTVAAIGVVIAVVVAVKTRESLARRRRWALGVVGAAGSWVTAVAMMGLDWDAIALLAAIGHLLALPWWREHRIPNPPLHLPAAPTLPVGIVPGLWQANVACPGGPLEGASLNARPETSTSVKDVYRVQLRPGRQTLATATAAMALIATGLHTAPEKLAFERIPGCDDTSQVHLTVVHTSPISGTVTYPGPAYWWDQQKRTGVIHLGPFFDGEGHAPWTLFTRGSIWGGIVIGGIGSGKSRLLEGLACSALSSGHVALWFADPQHGASSVALADHADWAARGPEECLDMLRSLSLVAHWRGIEAAAKGWTGFTPGRGRTALVAVLDECHMVFNHPVKEIAKEATRLAEDLVRVSRKLGVALICASQEGDLNTWGGSNALRSALRAGNTVVLRTENKECKNVLALPFDPTVLPKIPGYGYSVAGEELGGRTAPFRTFYLDELEEDEYDAVRAGGAPRECTSYWWLARTPSAPLDEVADRASGESYARRHEAAAQVASRLAGQLEELLSGRSGVRSPRPGIVDDPIGSVVTWPEWTPPSGPDLTASQQAVLDAIAAGADRPKAITEAQDVVKERQVYNVLAELQDGGLVGKRDGRYYVKAA